MNSQQSRLKSSRRNIFNSKNEQSMQIGQNISKLKTLLLDTRQVTRRNRLQFQQTQKSIKKTNINEKQNSPLTLRPNNPYISNSSPYKLITQLKQKIISPQKSQKKHHSQLLTSPPKNFIYLFQDHQIKNNNNVRNLIQQYTKVKGQLIREQVKGKKKQQIIYNMDNKIRKLVQCNQEQEVRFHRQVDQKNRQIHELINQHKQQQQNVKMTIQQFHNLYQSQIKKLQHKLSAKTTIQQAKLSNLQSKTIPTILKRINLQKQIFQSSIPYRSSPQHLQSSPYHMGDILTQDQNNLHIQQFNRIQNQIYIEKMGHQQEIMYYQMKYKLIQQEFQNMKGKYQQLIKEIQQLKRDQERRQARQVMRQAQLRIRQQQQRQKTKSKKNYSYMKDQSLKVNQIKTKNNQASPQILHILKQSNQLQSQSRSLSPRLFNSSKVTPKNVKINEISTPKSIKVQLKSTSPKKLQMNKSSIQFKQVHVQNKIQQQVQKHQKHQIQQQKWQISALGQIQTKRVHVQCLGTQTYENNIMLISDISQKNDISRISSNTIINKILSVNVSPKANQKQTNKNRSQYNGQSTPKSIHPNSNQQIQQHIAQLQHIKTMLQKIDNKILPQSSMIKNKSSTSINKSPTTINKQIRKLENLDKREHMQKQMAISKVKSLEKEVNYQFHKNNILSKMIGKEQQQMIIKENQTIIINQNQTKIIDQDQQNQKKNLNNYNQINIQLLNQYEIPHLNESRIFIQETPFTQIMEHTPKSQIRNLNQRFQWQSTLKRKLGNVVTKLDDVEQRMKGSTQSDNKKFQSSKISYIQKAATQRERQQI